MIQRATLLLLALLLPSTLAAKPMPPASLEKALASPLVIHARYLGVEPAEEVSYFGGLIARYEVVGEDGVWKGKLAEKQLRVRYAFQDGSACLEPPGWRFDPAMLPREGARFLLFLRGAVDGAHPTYRGGFGRWPTDALQPAELQDLRRLVQSPPPALACTHCQTPGQVSRRLHSRPRGVFWEAQCRSCRATWRELRFGWEDEAEGR